MLADKLEAKGVPIHRVEASHGRFAGQLMALGVVPGHKSIRGQYLSELPLIRFMHFLESQNMMKHYINSYLNKRKQYTTQIETMQKQINKLELNKSESSWWVKLRRRLRVARTAARNVKQ